MYKLAKEQLENKTLKQFQQAVSANLVDGAIDPQAGIALLTKGSIGAYTLRAPLPEEQGLTLTITSKTAFAHVVTSTGNIQNGVTGGAKNTATFAAFRGASITLIAIDSAWHLQATAAVTVA